MTGCCGDEVGDVTINTSINVQNQLFLFQLMQLYIAAAFDIDVAFPQTPDDFDSDPGDVGPEIAQRTRALCLASESWVNEVCNRGLSWIEGQKEEIAALIAAGVAVPAIPVYAVIGAFVGVGVLAGTVIQQLANDGYRAYLTCALFDALTGEDSNDPDAFHGALDSPPVRPPPPQNPLEDAARDLIEAWMRTQLASIDNYLGFIKLLNAAMGAASVLTDDDCICSASWEHTFDFTVSDGGWIDDPGRADFDATYAPGVGWQVVQASPGQSFGIALAMTQDAVFTEFCLVRSGPTVFNRVCVVEPMGTNDVDCLSVSQGTDTCTPTAFVCTLDFATQALKCLMSATASGLMTLSSLTLRGSGDNPFT